jgi:hypothetical protein
VENVIHTNAFDTRDQLWQRIQHEVNAIRTTAGRSNVSGSHSGMMMTLVFMLMGDIRSFFVTCATSKSSLRRAFCILEIYVYVHWRTAGSLLTRIYAVMRPSRLWHII